MNWACLRKYSPPNQGVSFEVTKTSTQDFENFNGRHLPTALWYKAEEPIKNDMEGDALSILDCCMASLAAMKGRVGLRRTYQLLAAASADARTCGPGQNSFTTALCESLEELLSEANGETFLLTQLSERINTKRRSQPCLLWDRLRAFKSTIQLGPLIQSPNLEDSFCIEGPEQASLYLRFSLKKSDLNDDQIESLAEHLVGAYDEAKVPLRRVDWMGMSTTKRKMTRTPGVHLDVSLGVEDESVLEVVDANGNNVFIPPPTRIYGAFRAVNTAQKWRSVVKRKNGNKVQLLGDDKMPLAQGSTWVMAVKMSSLLFMFGLLFFRKDRTGLFLWGAFVILMLLYGPCRVHSLRHCLRWERSRYDS